MAKSNIWKKELILGGGFRGRVRNGGGGLKTGSGKERHRIFKHKHEAESGRDGSDALEFLTIQP